MPGGGVDPGETVEETARREVLEETGYRIEGRVRLFGIYHSRFYTNRNHVTVFIADDAHQEYTFSPNHEIAGTGWFDMDAPPQDMSPGTARRLAEIRGEAEISPFW
ncbi:NUDIX domain-containing protein [Pelagibacterium sediminicola]|uniref:NUDIX domain-containing protein n=1 Tax=Pelagibacterium sediminicola TaxID=2248761 RepID=UPI000E320E04|nr:NUDIX domain-containing protein [Pelagibacterium sediminicola]